MNLKELREKQARLLTEARARLDEITPETPEGRARELESQHDAAMAEYDRLEDVARRELALAEREERARQGDPGRRPHEDGRADQVEIVVDERQAFTRCLLGLAPRNDSEQRAYAGFRAQLTPEMRAQSTTAAAGGYTIPQGFLPEIERAMAAYGPMFQPGTTRQLNTESGNALPWPTMDDTGNTGRLLGENTQVTETALTFGQKSLGAYTFSSDLVLVSLQLTQDSAFNMEDEIITPAFGERLGRTINTYLTTGTGSSQPQGIVTGSTLGKTAASASAIAADELIDFYHSVDPAYRSSPLFKFMFHDTTLQAIRKLKDGQGNYLVGGLNNDAGTINLAGIKVPYAINQAMPQIGTGNKVIVGGDLNKYIARRVREFTLLKLVERYADYLQVGFVAFMRADGLVSNTAAIKHYKMA